MGKYEELRDGLNNLLESHGLNHVYRSVTCERSVLPVSGHETSECYAVFHLPGLRGNMAYRSSDPAAILGLVDWDCGYAIRMGLIRCDDGGESTGPPPLPTEAEKQRTRPPHRPEDYVSPALIAEEFTRIDQEIDVLRQRLSGCDEVMLSHADAIRELQPPDEPPPVTNGDVLKGFEATCEAEKLKMQNDALEKAVQSAAKQLDLLDNKRAAEIRELGDKLERLSRTMEAWPRPARNPWAPFSELENRVAAMENPPTHSSPEFLELEARIAQLEKRKFKGLQGGS